MFKSSITALFIDDVMRPLARILICLGSSAQELADVSRWSFVKAFYETPDLWRHDKPTNMQWRIYDPEIGRFLSADPFVQFPESTQGFNRYTYVGNNPLSYTDPSGYFSLSKTLKGFGNLLSEARKAATEIKGSRLCGPAAHICAAAGTYEYQRAIGAPGETP